MNNQNSIWNQLASSVQKNWIKLQSNLGQRRKFFEIHHHRSSTRKTVHRAQSESGSRIVGRNFRESSNPFLISVTSSFDHSDEHRVKHCRRYSLTSSYFEVKCSSPVSFSSSTTTTSGDYHSFDSISSCSTASSFNKFDVYNNSSSCQCESDLTNENCAKSVSPLFSDDNNNSASKKLHSRSCHCKVCFQHIKLFHHERVTRSRSFEIIREESEPDDDDDGQEQEEQESNLRSQKNLRPTLKMDGIEPFQKPENLNQFWHEPKEWIAANRMPRDRSSKISVSSLSDHGCHGKTRDNTVDDTTMAASSLSSIHHPSSHQNIFQRDNYLRSSCPPPSSRSRQRQRPQRRSRRSTSSTGSSSSNSKVAPSQQANHVTTTSSNGNLVEAIQTKLSAVRKSWLFSIFHSKDKSSSSKWTKSDDFEAEFYDHHAELTENLVNRRSPLSLIDLNSHASHRQQQMSVSSLKELPMTSSSLFKTTKQSNNSNNNNNQNNDNEDDNFDISGNNNIVQLRRPRLNLTDQSGFLRTSCRLLLSNKKPRPRSSCLENTSHYMLRMRNGNVIEYNLDSDERNETCSIISPRRDDSSCLLKQPIYRNSNHFVEKTSKSSFIDHQDHQDHHHHQGRSPNNNNNKLLSNDNDHCGYNKNNNRNQTFINHQSYLNPSNSETNSGSLVSTSIKSYPLSTVTSTTTTTDDAGSSLSNLNFLSQQQKNRKPTSLDVLPTTGNCCYLRSSNEVAKSWISSPLLSTDHQTMVIYWPVKQFSDVQITEQCSAFDVIKRLLTSQVLIFNLTSSAPRNSIQHLPLPKNFQIYAYSLRLIDRKYNSNDHVWIHPTKNMHEFIQQNKHLLERGWKFELRVRYMPPNLEELYRKDFVTFKFLYEQVLEDFLAVELPSTSLFASQDLIIELACYEIARTHPHLMPQAIEKSSNWESLQQNFDIIFPASVLNILKPKLLRKLVKAKFKKVYTMSQEKVMFGFLNMVTQLVNYKREFFHCSLGESAWSVPVDLMIGSDCGISYFTSSSSPSKTIVESFDQIEQINIVSYSTLNKPNEENGQSEENTGTTINSNMSSKKILLNLRIKNEDDLLAISCSSFSIAQNIADLIDGYHRLTTNVFDSIWLNIVQDKNSLKTNESNNSTSGQSSMKSNLSEIIEPKLAQFDIVSPQTSSLGSTRNSHMDSSDSNEIENEHPEEADYSNPVESCLEIFREKLLIEELVGNGQFGDVHKGVYLKPTIDGLNSEKIPVAIKISRIQQNDKNEKSGKNDLYLADQKLLCEAERMHKLDHVNIIKLIGVCSSSPVYVIMELAEYGELRSFLQKHGSQLEFRRLIEYSYQIASAMTYLESHQFVHRDIAARNVLVFSFDCVKLADFGLSRYIEDTSYYVATNSKLPIKWMAPESINFRRFTTASDVWMFGVCVWEIFMLGKKPFQGVKNSDVINLIECEDRLEKPSRCPDQLYQILLKCWRYEPDRRPNFRAIKRKIYDVYQNELGLIGAIARADISKDISSSKSSLSSVSNDKELSSSTSSSLSRIHFNKINNPLKQKTNQKYMPLSKSNSSLNTSQSSVLNSNKIKKILEEQRKQMEEDQKWLAKNEFKWNTNETESVESSDDDNDEENSTSTSVYEDAHCDNRILEEKGINNDHWCSMPNMQIKHQRSDSEKSPQPSMGKHSTTSSSVSGCSSVDKEDCGLSVSLKKFFKHNRLTNSKVRQQMLDRVNCASADMDRKNDPVYWSTINVVNAVSHLLKGVQELNTESYIDLVKNVGQELRNLLSSVDFFSETISSADNRGISLAQKKLSADMNDLIESMKKTVVHSDTPIEGAYKQNMLEAAYVLVIDSKNLLDTVDETRLIIKKENS